MIKELVQFVENLSMDIRNSVNALSKGVNIMVDIDDSGNISYEHFYIDGTENNLSYNKDKVSAEMLNQTLLYENYSSYISINQQQKFDKLQKIHSASPFSFAFNFSFGNPENTKNAKAEMKKRIDRGNTTDSMDIALKKYKIEDVKLRVADYFKNAKQLCLQSDRSTINYEKKLAAFQAFCSDQLYEILSTLTTKINQSKKKDEVDLNNVSIFEKLKEKDYVRVYLKSIPNELWKSAYEQYYNGEYPPNELNDSDFITAYDSKKPFLMHQTASFESNIKILGTEATILKEFEKLLSAKPRIIPNPLPIFIFKDELKDRVAGIPSDGIQESEGTENRKQLQKQVIALFKPASKKEKEKEFGYKEIIERLWGQYKEEFNNYYLINWYRGKGLVIQDFDFVSRFQYDFDANIENCFGVWDSNNKKERTNQKISNVFELEQYVFNRLIGNKYKKIDYFGDLDNEAFKDRDKTPNLHWDESFVAFTKYRRAVYDFVFKSMRQGINTDVLKDMVFSGIKDDIKQNNGNRVKEKLNIWYSMYEKFNYNNHNNQPSMASKLMEYLDFVGQLAIGKADVEEATDKHFAFAAGQVIEYVIQKSKAESKSYQLLEPYLQQSKCSELKKAISNDIARYKHAINDNETKFKEVCAFVQTWETNTNMKDLLPEILAGVFSKNQFFKGK
jgi:CRISPR-associated protein Csh1